MAVFNEILVGRFNRGLSKLLGIKGPAPAPQISSEFMAVIAAPQHNDTEFNFQWDRYGASATQAAVAAAFSSIWIRNPANSNILVIIDSVDIASFGGALVCDIFQNTNTGDLGGAFPGIRRLDGRTKKASNSSLSIGAPGALPGAPSQIGVVGAAQGVSVQFIADGVQELILFPNDTYQFAHGVVNTALTIALRWRERLLEESELIS